MKSCSCNSLTSHSLCSAAPVVSAATVFQAATTSCTAEHACSGYGCGCRGHSAVSPSTDASGADLELRVRASPRRPSVASATVKIHVIIQSAADFSPARQTANYQVFDD